MATEFYSLFTITCDDPVDEDLCWKEMTLYVNEGETKKDAIDFLTSIDWEILADNLCVCPFCAKGIRKSEFEKKSASTDLSETDKKSNLTRIK
jgi:hypothetical protein